MMHQAKFKQNSVFILCGLALSIATYAQTYCPALSITSFCVNGKWQVSVTPNSSSWEFMGDSVNGTKCASNDEANDVRWNYAFASARMGIVGCNYKLFDNKLNQIGLIQIKSTQYIRVGSNWEKGSYPGNWTCYESQTACLFS